MTHRLATNYAKNYCNRTPIVKVIVENVVICFLGHTCSSINKRDQLISASPFLYKKAQLSLTNPRDAKACQKLLQFDVLTTLSLTMVYIHSFTCCCVRNLRNPKKFS